MPIPATKLVSPTRLCSRPIKPSPVGPKRSAHAFAESRPTIMVTTELVLRTSVARKTDFIEHILNETGSSSAGSRHSSAFCWCPSRVVGPFGTLDGGGRADYQPCVKDCWLKKHR